MSETYVAKYKCRLCGKEFNSAITGITLAQRCMLQVTADIPSKEPLCPTIYHTHFCDDDSFGVADFLGFKKEV